MRRDDLLTIARGYRADNINLLPIRPDGSKAPAIQEWADLQHRTLTDEEVVRFFSNGNGLAAIGGKISGGLEDFDFDDPGIFEEWKLLVIQHLGQTFWDKLLIVRTPRPGYQVPVRSTAARGNQKLARRPNPGHDPANPNSKAVDALIEIKGEGGYFLLPGCPPECHITGRTYDPLQGSYGSIPVITPEERETLISCARSFDEMPRLKYEEKVKRERKAGELLPGEDFNERGDWRWLLERHGFKFDSQRGEVSRWTRPGKSRGVSATTNFGGSDCFYPFSSSIAGFDQEKGYSKFAVYTFLEHDGDFSQAAKELCRQGYGTRVESKRKITGNGHAADQATAKNTTIDESHDDFFTESDAEASEPRPTKYSDDALADIFSTRHGQDFLYVHSWGWLRWTHTRWQRVSDVVVMGYARQICRQQSKLCKEDPDISGKAQQGLARALASAKVVAAVVKLASTDARHYREVSQFDQDLWLFNTPGGTIELKTGTLREHRREDLITKIAKATPKGECPKWLAVLDRITGNKELKAYLQRLAGYAMCGDPSEECIDFFYGQGGNGKGTFLKTLEYVFGEYATTAATETFLEAKGERHPTDIAKLAGARLVIAQEIDENQHWNESRLKTMTGRDTLTARFMRRDLFDFVPQFTLIISGNNRPSLKTVDEAWRRRFHLVPFDVTIPKKEQKPDLKTELQAEADGILRWCVEGCLEWQRQRLNPPEIVLTATEEYLEAEDTFEMWLSECCLRGHEGYEERKILIYTSHRAWKQERGERPPGMKTFSQRIQKHGFRSGQETSGERARVFQGLRLTDEERVKAKAGVEAQRRREQGARDSAEDYLG